MNLILEQNESLYNLKINTPIDYLELLRTTVTYFKPRKHFEIR